MSRDNFSVHVRGRQRNTTRSSRYLSQRPARGLGVPEALDNAVNKELRKIERHILDRYRAYRVWMKMTHPEATPEQRKSYFQAAMSCVGELSFEDYLKYWC